MINIFIYKWCDTVDTIFKKKIGNTQHRIKATKYTEKHAFTNVFSTNKVYLKKTDVFCKNYQTLL